MKLVYQGLRAIYPKMLHVTCLAHGLHRVAEQVRIEYPFVNEWIVSVKRIFLKSPSRNRAFKDAAPQVPLPPEPIITRWGTWIEAALFHSKHSRFLVGFDPADSSAIEVW